MNLKRAILQGLDVGQARWFVDAFHVSCPRGTDLRALRELLAEAPLVTSKALLEPLHESDVRALCRRLGLPSSGRRSALVASLLALDIEPLPNEGLTFAAIDFETADHHPDSACAVSIVRVEGSEIASQVTRLIRPPRSAFEFTHIHGISWSDVRNEPAFGEVWPALVPLLEGVSFLAAHNAAFDRGVLQACCSAAEVPVPLVPFRCTVQIARKAWNLRPTRLPDVCAHLGISLNHHDPASDAEACARIVLAAGAHRVFPHFR